MALLAGLGVLAAEPVELVGRPLAVQQPYRRAQVLVGLLPAARRGELLGGRGVRVAAAALPSRRVGTSRMPVATERRASTCSPSTVTAATSCCPSSTGPLWP